MIESLEQLAKRHGEKVRAILNYLIETPYFYKSDHETHFYFLSRHKRVFEKFYRDFYGWSFYMDNKCARVLKDRWYNDAITPANRDIFDFTRRDEALAFMILLEFFEIQIDEQAMTVDEAQNLRFHYGDLLVYSTRRFQEVFPGDERYQDEFVRKILAGIIPTLIRYRFIKKEKIPQDVIIGNDEQIYEALPALYHYNTSALSRSINTQGEESC